MKRFTETLKWSDPWFRRLSAHAKMLWLYALDHCDNIGLVELDLEFVAKDCGTKITEAHVVELGDRIERVSEVKFFLPKFIKFQYGQLSASCPAHKKVLQAVSDHCLLHDSLGYHYPNARVLSTLQDKKKTGKEEDKVGESAERGSNAEALPFPSEAFATAWSKWIKHRQEIKKPLTPGAIEQQLKLMAGMGEARTIAMIQNSIAGGYQGLFEPKPGFSQPGKPKNQAYNAATATDGMSGDEIGTF